MVRANQLVIRALAMRIPNKTARLSRVSFTLCTYPRKLRMRFCVKPGILIVEKVRAAMLRCFAILQLSLHHSPGATHVRYHRKTLAHVGG